MTDPIFKRNLLFKYAWYEQETRWYILLMLVGSLILTLIFKYYYPLPNFATDSVNYFKLADTNIRVDNTSLGYAYFLRYFKPLISHDTFLFYFQYYLIQLALLDLLLSVYFLLNTAKWVTRLILLVLHINPLFLHVANLATPDSIFISLSLLYFTNLLWSNNDRSSKTDFINGIIWVLAFSFNHTAIWYLIPTFLITIWETSFQKNVLKNSSVSIGIPILFLTINVFISDSKYGDSSIKSTGGWQLASNALFAYYYSPDINPSDLPKKFEILNDYVKHHKDSLKTLWIRPDTILNNYYLIDESSPLQKYLFRENFIYHDKAGLSNYTKTGTLYREYGSLLIKNSPKSYIHHFILPNTIYYYTPLKEAFEFYNRSLDTVENEIQTYFRYKDNKVKFKVKSWRIPYMYKAIPVTFAITKILFVVLTLSFMVISDYKREDKKLIRFIILSNLLFFTNLLFSIAYSPVTIRVQTYAITIAFIYDIILMSWLINILNINKKPPFSYRSIDDEHKVFS